jgi:hypothetical protein
LMQEMYTKTWREICFGSSQISRCWWQICIDRHQHLSEYSHNGVLFYF